MLLYRSSKQYKNMYCVNGRSGIHGCKLCSSKSTRVIEDCLLGFLRDTVLTEQSIDELVVRANARLKSLASPPKVNVAPLRSQIASLQKKIDSFVQRVENLKESEVGLREGYERRIIQQQQEVDELKKQLRETEQTNAPVPPKLSKKTLRAYLPELRAILNQEIPVAAESIRRLTGLIAIRQEAIPGKKRGARWIASFSPDLLALLRHVTQETDCPDSVTLVSRVAEVFLEDGGAIHPVGGSSCLSDVHPGPESSTWFWTTSRSTVADRCGPLRPNGAKRSSCTSCHPAARTTTASKAYGRTSKTMDELLEDVQASLHARRRTGKYQLLVA